MKFHLEASLRLSGDAASAEAALSEFFAGAALALQNDVGVG